MLLAYTLSGLSLTGCGPDARPDRPCDGPTFVLTLRAEPGPLPSDTRINVRYGVNHDGEPYELGQTQPGQAVFCDEQSDASGAAGAASDTGDVQTLSCRLFTQGPARLDASATGYEPVEDEALLLEGEDRCEVPIEVVLLPSTPDTGD